MRKRNPKVVAFMFWALLVCGIINAYLFFISMSVPALSHLKEQHLLMVAVCALGVVINYFRLGEGKNENRNNGTSPR